jgi:large conductance mechanosensitive channel
MSGFKNFLLRGNLIELAVAFIIGAAFATLVAAFTELITSLLPSADTFFNADDPVGRFLNALIAFLLLATIVYFFVVLPYTKAKERFFPAEEPGEPAEVALLTEIRDILASQNRGGSTTAAAGPATGGSGT